MTSVAETARGFSWRGRLAWVALALSLTLNVFFVGGLIFTKMTAGHPFHPAERFQEIGRELGLTPEQHAAFRDFGRTVHEGVQHLRQSNEPILQQVWSELAKPSPDQATIAKLVGQASENRRAFQRSTAAALSGFMATLSTEQRARFADIAMRRQDAVTHRIWRMILP